MRRRFRRNPSRRNSPYGSTSAEREMSGNPRRSGSGSGVLLGTLDELVVDQGGETITAKKSRLRGLYLAWIPSSKSLAIVRKALGQPGELSNATRQIHKLFHNTEPTASATYEWPERTGREYRLGLIRSLTYVVPPKIKSPEKHGYKWVHKFGDHGEEGHGPMRGEKQYSDTLKPYLLENAKGDLFIQRRPGNKFDVTKWIYW